MANPSECHRRPTLYRDFLQVHVDEEPYPLAIGREERIAGVLCTCEEGTLPLVEQTHGELLNSIRRAGEKHQTASIWRWAKLVLAPGMASRPRSRFRRRSGYSLERVARHSIAMVTGRAMKSTAVNECVHRPRPAAKGRAGGVKSSGSFSAIRASPMACSRWRTSRVRHRRTRPRMATGVPAGSAVQSGSTFSTLAKVSDTDSPSNVPLFTRPIAAYFKEKPPEPAP